MCSKITNITRARTILEGFEPRQTWRILPYLEKREIHQGERSLHIGSKGSLLPFAEAVCGARVTVTDVEQGLIDVKDALRSFKEEAQKHDIPPIDVEIEQLDVLALEGRFQEGAFNHVTMQNVFSYSPFLCKLDAMFGGGPSQNYWGRRLPMALLTLGRIFKIMARTATLSITDDEPLVAALSRISSPEIGNLKYEIGFIEVSSLREAVSQMLPGGGGQAPQIDQIAAQLPPHQKGLIYQISKPAKT